MNKFYFVAVVPAAVLCLAAFPPPIIGRNVQGFALLLITVFCSLVLTLVLVVPFRAAVERRLAEKC